MIDGIKTYGSTELTEKLQEVEDDAVFLLTIGTTETSLIEGISGAGPSADLTEYTPASDAEFMVLGEVRCCEAPAETVVGDAAAPTPARLTKAALQVSNIPFVIVDAGSKIKPDLEYVNLGKEYGRDIRTGKLTDCGFLIGRAMRNVPKLNSFISGPLVVFLNGRIFDTEVDAGEFTDLNGSSQVVQYSLGLSRNIIFPVYHMTSTNLDLASRFILTWSGTERTVFYDYMFPHDSLDNYHTIFGVRDCMLNTPKYKVY